MAKVYGQLFKLVDSAISATAIADRCIKSSTPPCNHHRQTLAVECLLKNSVTFSVAPLKDATFPTNQLVKCLPC